MKNKFLGFALILLIAVFVVPQIALAAWWNPFTWNWNISSWFSKPQVIQPTKTIQQNQEGNKSQIQTQVIKPSVTPTKPSAKKDLSQTAVWCHTFNTNLKIGDSGDEVVDLNKTLDYYFIGYTSQSSANFDKNTQDKVNGFQQYSGITQTGVVDQATREKLNLFIGCKVNNNDIPEIIRVFSYALSDDFYVYPGEAFTIQGAHLVGNIPDNTSVYFYNNGKDSAAISEASDGLISAIAPLDLKIGSNYGLYVANQNGTSSEVGVKVASANMLIQPSIVFTYPKGGEIWKVGSTHNITWNSNGLTSADSLSMTLMGSNVLNSEMYVINQSENIPYNINSYSWTIPSSVKPGEYYVLIQNMRGNPKATGGVTSNRSFNISVVAQ